MHEVHGLNTIYIDLVSLRPQLITNSKVISILSTVSTGNTQYKLVRDNIEHNSCAMINGLGSECDLTV